MPLDGTLYAPDLTEFQPGDQGLRQLAYLLRHQEKWRRGFRWDFGDLLIRDECGTAGCAIGLAYLHWGEAVIGNPLGNNCDMFASYKLFGLDKENGSYLFNTSNAYGVDEMSQVTPVMVANAIDFFLVHRRMPGPGESSP